jgi:hypothetical protein
MQDKPSIKQQFEAWKQMQGRTRIVLFWSGLWSFAAIFCLTVWFMIHTSQPTKLEYYTMAIVGFGFYGAWPLVVFRRKN